jgi:multiple sugar transport system substrate-binding protein
MVHSGTRKKELNMIRRKCILFLLIFVVVSYGIFAAGTKDRGASGPITLQYWTHTAPTLIDVNNQLIKEFEAKNPDITIEYTPVGTSEDLYNKLVTAYAGKVAPDVFWLPDWWVPRFAELGMAAKVPEYVGDLESRYESRALDGYRWKGDLYTAGISEYNTLSIIYNKEIFANAGVPFPSEVTPMTLDELVNVASKLTSYDKGKRVVSGFEFLRVPLFPANWVALIWEPILQQQGAGFLDKSTGLPDFLAPEVINLFSMMQKMEQESKVADTSFVVNLFDDFAKGRIAMIIAGAWAPPIIKTLNPNADFGIAPLPVVKGGDRQTVLYSWGWVVNPSTPHAEAAWKFAQFLAQEHPDLWWEKAGYIQPLKGQLDKLAQTQPVLATFIDDFKYGAYTLRSTYFTEITSVLGQVQSRVMSENVDVRKVLSDAQNEILKLIEH